jgi:hypothetical protein
MEEEDWIPPSAQPCSTNLPKVNDENAAQKCLKRKATPAAPQPVIDPPLKRMKILDSTPQESAITQDEQCKYQARQTIRLECNGTALPSRKIFDPWNLNSAGHQKAENALGGTIAWRESRENKLYNQFRAGKSGGRRVADLVGAGATGSGKIGDWIKGLKQDSKQPTIRECLATGRQRRSQRISQRQVIPLTKPPSLGNPSQPLASSPPDQSPTSQPSATLNPTIFANVVIYINGSTLPLISDHAIRQLIVQHGGRTSIALLRKTVTHVILTPKAAAPATAPDAPPSTLAAEIRGLDRERALRQVTAGGGLAAGKVAREVVLGGSGRGERVLYVSPAWVLDSVKAGRRLSERNYMDWRFVAARQGSVMRYFGPAKANANEKMTDEIMRNED